MLGDMHEDRESCLRAVRSRDTRFDGWFTTAVTSTGIYCRPSCPATPPRAEHVVFYPSAAAAQAAGFRACKRCRPDASPGSPEWNAREDLVARAMRLVADGVVDRDGVDGLARRLGYSARQVERLVTAELGVGPLALARAQRAQTARILVETTDLPMAEVAFAAGFSSVRSFNDTVRAVFAETPTHLRRRVRRSPTVGGRRDAGHVPPSDPTGSQRLRLRLPFRAPLHAPSLFGHLAATAVPGIERWVDGSLERTLRLPRGAGLVRLHPPRDGDRHVTADLWLQDLRDLTTAINRCRRCLDLDADPAAVDEVLSADPALAPAVAARPGVRLPGTVDPVEFAVRAVLGQQVSTAAAATTTGRLVRGLGEPLPPSLVLRPGQPDLLFPRVADLAAVGPDDPRLPGMPASRRRALLALATAAADGSLDLGADAVRDGVRARLDALPGVGPWTREVIALRGLGDPDAFPVTDLGVRAGAAALGLPVDQRGLLARAEDWRPWRAYAVQALWAATTHPVATLPVQTQEIA
ncbi:AlkA N-terminal domain-containing protein [Ornithinicoccus hortensis]|uniref:DNA-3-methyladenine glycosylase II n=2 Tax=Ornithinicoccus hortensis TaxID=82346 RepID=A0A542YVX4_9MICO|nr:DNA-3-methyladenine glycosylase II [Ornithinicoccus hortensis]